MTLLVQKLLKEFMNYLTKTKAVQPSIVAPQIIYIKNMENVIKIKCTKCNTLKCPRDFYPSALKKGRAKHCKDCNLEYAQKYSKENRDKINEYAREYSKKIPAVVKNEQHKKWRAENPEKFLEYQRRYSKENNADLKRSPLKEFKNYTPYEYEAFFYRSLKHISQYKNIDLTIVKSMKKDGLIILHKKNKNE